MRVPLQIALVACALTAGASARGIVHAQRESNAMPSVEASRLHERGREAGQRGDFQQALALLTKAAALAPDWPYPIYDRAFTHLLMNNFDAALSDYQQTLKLSPRGFFTAHAAVDTLLREKRGQFPAGLYLAYVMLEEENDPQRRRTVLEQLVQKYPRFALAWKDYAQLAETPAENLRRIESGLAADPDPETLGLLKINQALALRSLGKPDAATAILRALVSDPKSTTSTVAWAKSLLSPK